MFNYPKPYDVIVIGAGHAGVEAAFAAARMGCQVAVLTQNLDTIGQMSCNPAIGGLAKGHLVREIDALGGVMGENADATAIQWRLLNASKGPSVRAPRAQCDKKAYQLRMKYLIEMDSNIDIHQGNVAEILIKQDQVKGVRTSLDLQLEGKTVILSAGTFMRGLMHVGKQNERGGRMGDAISTISDQLKQLGFEVDRFKTGTPCRINGTSINFSECEKQEGDFPPPLFSYMSHQLERKKEDIFTLNNWGDPNFRAEQIPCWVTWTQSKTHDIIRNNLDLSPMYSGQIEGVGPRYCPSIEDKVVRFADKERHQVFLEPEGRHSQEYYVNGVSTSLPYSVQFDFIRSIAGLENAQIIRPGYAVEYDYCSPTQLSMTLETKRIAGLYFAGQVNGTSGYEEAAGQGLWAGVNAACKIQGKEEFILGRDEAYLGVLIDDLVTKGCREPYRLFTSRAEYRLLLRQDNADQRLTGKAIEFSLASDSRKAHFNHKMSELKRAEKLVRLTNHEGLKLDAWFRRPENSWQALPKTLQAEFSQELWCLIETEYRYEGYLNRQRQQVQRLQKQEKKPIPDWVDYQKIKGLKREAQEKFIEIRPSSLGQAQRISGITPADIAILYIWIEKGKSL